MRGESSAKAMLKRMERADKIWKWVVVPVVVLVFLFIGSVMIFGMHYWEKPISREEAISTTASYQSCQKRRAPHSLAEIEVHFSDLDRQKIDGSYATDELYQTIDALAPGTQLSLLLHPNSATILEIRVGDELLLDFDHAVRALRGEVAAFTVLGIMLYLAAAACALTLIPGKYRRKIRIFHARGREIQKTQLKTARQILRVYFQPLYEMLLAGALLAGMALLVGLLAEAPGRFLFWFLTAAATFFVFLLIPIRLLVYWVRVRRELRSGQIARRSVCVREILGDRKLTLSSFGNLERSKFILTATNGSSFRFVCDSFGICESVELPVQKLEISYLPDTGFLLSVVPYLHRKEEKREKQRLRAFFSLYLTGKYKYETQGI